jgi:RNA ligase (TIGR02306 family)
MIINKPGMAWGGKIDSLASIEGADRIVRAEVVCGKGGRWSCVVPVSMGLGDKVVVFLPDAIVPNLPETAFMERRDWRVRMAKFKGCPSEVLAVPIGGDYQIGDDMTIALGVRKYEKEIPAQHQGKILGDFPHFIPKTDEPNFQKVSEFLEALEGRQYYASVKYDGSSQTAYRHKGHFGVCSRNWELQETDVPAWRLAHQYALPDALTEGYAVQWECIGPKVQGNPHSLDQIQMRVFNVYHIEAQEYLGLSKMQQFCEDLGLPVVDLVSQGIWESKTFDELRQMACGDYHSGQPREGIVIRPTEPMRVSGELLSFKIINLDYKES